MYMCRLVCSLSRSYLGEDSSVKETIGISFTLLLCTITRIPLVFTELVGVVSASGTKNRALRKTRICVEIA